MIQSYLLGTKFDAAAPNISIFEIFYKIPVNFLANIPNGAVLVHNKRFIINFIASWFKIYSNERQFFIYQFFQIFNVYFAICGNRGKSLNFFAISETNLPSTRSILFNTTSEGR